MKGKQGKIRGGCGRGDKAMVLNVLLKILSELLKNLDKISIIIASLAAIWGISSWRREMKEKRRYELAEEVLSLFYEARDKIRFIRSPLSFSDEGKSRKAAKDETPEEKKTFDQAFITIERYNKNLETFNKLNSLQYRFMAVFGRNKIEPFQQLNDVISDIHIAAKMLGLYWWKLNNRRINEDKLMEKIDEYEKIIWSDLPNDPIEPKVNEIIKNIENICCPILIEKKNKKGVIR